MPDAIPSDRTLTRTVENQMVDSRRAVRQYMRKPLEKIARYAYGKGLETDSGDSR